MIMERYLNFVERYARAIVFLLVAITAYFTYTLGALVSDTNPYLLKESHPARKTIIDLQGEFTGTFDSVMVALNNPQTVFNKQTLNALFSMSQSVRKMILANDADKEQLAQIVGKYPNDSRAQLLTRDILEGGFSQNDYAQAKALRDHAQSQNWDSHDQLFLTFLAERINPIREMASMGDLENIVLTDDGELLIHKTLNAYDMDPAVVESQIMGNELMVDGVVSKDKKVAMLVAELGTKQDDAQAQLRAYQIVRGIVAQYQAEHPEYKDEIFIAGMPIFIAAQQEIIDHDLAVLFPIVFLLITLLLTFFFRKPLGVLLPLFNILFCTIWTLGPDGAVAGAVRPADQCAAGVPVHHLLLGCDPCDGRILRAEKRRQEQSRSQPRNPAPDGGAGGVDDGDDHRHVHDFHHQQHCQHSQFRRVHVHRPDGGIDHFAVADSGVDLALGQGSAAAGQG